MLRSPLQGPALPAIGLIALVMAAGATLIRDPYYQLILSTVPIWALVALTWNLFSGYSGLISFGHSTFFGLGAFAVALLALQDAALRDRLNAYRAEQTAVAQSMVLPPLAPGNGA